MKLIAVDSVIAFIWHELPQKLITDDFKDQTL